MQVAIFVRTQEQRMERENMFYLSIEKVRNGKRTHLFCLEAKTGDELVTFTSAIEPAIEIGCLAHNVREMLDTDDACRTLNV